MSHTTQILAVISGILVLLLVAPNVFRFNMARGTTLRNIAIWLLIFVALILAYRLMHHEPLTLQPGSVAAPDGSV